MNLRTPDPPPNAAERLVTALRAQHERIAIDLDRNDEKAPGWFLHLPSGGVMPIHLITSRGPLVRVTGFAAGQDAVDFVMLAPECVVTSIRSLAPDEPRRPIGFEWPDNEAGE